MTSRPPTHGALLFVPGDRPDRFDKAVASGADQVILDLEDAVAEDDKDAARDHVACWLARGNAALVRINASGTAQHDDDLGALVHATARGARGVLLPKAEDPSSVARVVGACPVPVLALVETPAGLSRAEVIAAAGVHALVFGNVDFAACLGVDPASHQALLVARSTLVYASAAAGIGPPVDGVTTSLRSAEPLRADLDHARELGFGGKLCVHPDQVRATRACFAPTEAEVRWAAAVTGAARATASVASVDGEMVDPPVLRRAQGILDRVAQPKGTP